MTTAIPDITLIKAGAGAGKTYRIQTTLAEWVKSDKVQANRILAVTFTNAAASEMRQRIKLALLGAGQTEQAAQLQQSVITTIHAFGLNVLERFAFEQGLSPTPRQLNENEQQYLLAQILSELETVVALVDNADRFGYKATKNKDGYQDKYLGIQKTVLRAINTLRSIGKGSQQNNVDEIAATIEQTQQALADAYGEPDSAERLNSELADAIDNARKNLPGEEVLQELWGKGNQEFVKSLFGIDLENITKDWSHWATLQTLGAPTKVHGSKNKPGDAEHIALVEAVTTAASQLYRHPGPLQDALHHIQDLMQSALEAIERYQLIKRDAGLVDYTDMVGLAHQMMHNDAWLEELASQFDCLIIDEFQDTNPLQYALLYRLHEQGVPVFIVGDLKQGIMGFQGADSRLFAGLLDRHKNTPDAVQELDNNWRSTAALMTFINAMGAELYGREYTHLTPQVKTQSDLTPVRILHFDRANWLVGSGNKARYAHEGYQLLANEIVKLLQPASGKQVIDKHSRQKRPIRPSDIAVLAKNNSSLEAFAKVLRASGINVQIEQNGFLQCPLVTLMLDALQALNNRNDQFAWAALATSPLLTDKPVRELQALLKSAVEKLQAKEAPAWQQTFDHPLKDTLTAACKGITKQPLATQLLAIAQELNLFEIIKQYPDYEQYRANLLKLQQLATQFEQQAEQALEALGIIGKNAATFPAWLQTIGSRADSDVNKQPLANPVASDAVVLATWHKSKGLEWPVVMVLQAEDVPEARLPSIAVEYKQVDNDATGNLLDSSQLQILTSFADKESKQRMLNVRKADTEATAKNLYYVALTRAREQLIIPVLEEEPKKDKQAEKQGQMYRYVLPVAHRLLKEAETDSTKASVVELESMTATKDGVTQLELGKAQVHSVLDLKPADPDQKKETLKHSVTPSKHKEEHAAPLIPLSASKGPGEEPQPTEKQEEFGDRELFEEELQEAALKEQQLQQQEEQAERQALSEIATSSRTVQQHLYQPAFDLDALGYQGPANELGIWMHRLYQVYLQQPALLPRAMAMQPCNLNDERLQQELENHLQGFHSALENMCGGIKSLRSEVPVTGLNEHGQVISGVIDLLAEDINGNWWIIDHKTDTEAVSKGYWEQLHAYRRILQKSRHVAGCVLNWTKHGELSVLRM